MQLATDNTQSANLEEFLSQRKDESGNVFRCVQVFRCEMLLSNNCGNFNQEKFLFNILHRKGNILFQNTFPILPEMKKIRKL